MKFAFAVLLIALASTGQAAEKKAKKAEKVEKMEAAPAKPSAEQVSALVAVLSELEGKAKKCRSTYHHDIEISESTFRANLMGEQLRALESRGREDLTAVEIAKVREKTSQEFKERANFPACQEKARASVSAEFPVVLKSLPSALHVAAKASMAQWLTAIDAVPSEKFEDELSKFRLSINNLRVEAM